MVGRDAEVAALEGVVGSRGTGRPRIALVRGEAGIGKSRLIEAMLAGPEARGLAVVRCDALRLERDHPFAPLLAALKIDVETLTLSDASSETGQPQDYKIREAILDRLEARGTAGRLLLIVEDLHWVDVGTLLTLEGFVRRFDENDARLVCTLRPAPRGIELETLLDTFASLDVVNIELGPLDGAATNVLATALAGGAPGPKLRDALRRAGGNPLFIRELLTSLAEEQLLAIDETGVAELSRDVLPPSLRLTILRRVGLLPPDVVEVLRIAAVLGSSFRLADLALAQSAAVPELARLMRTPIAAQLIEDVGDGRTMRFRHELVRDAIYEDTPLAVRRLLHRHLGAALVASSAPSIEIAHHMVMGAEPGDQEAIASLERAATEVHLRAPSIAVGLLESALALRPDRPARVRIRLAIARALVSSGQPSAAETLARELVADAEGVADRDSAEVVLLRALMQRGRYAEAVERAGVAARRGRDARGRVRFAWEGSVALLMSGRLAEATSAAKQAMPSADTVDTVAAIGLRTALAVASMLRGFLPEAVESAQEAFALASGLGRHDAADLHVDYNLASTLARTDRLTDALQIVRAGLLRVEVEGRLVDEPRYHSGAGWILWLLGRWDEAVAEMEAGLALAEEVESQFAKLTFQGALAEIAIHRGQLARAAELLAAPMPETEARYDLYAPLLARALLAETKGDAARATVSAMAADDIFLATGALGHYRTFGPMLVRMFLTTSDTARAERVAENASLSAERAQLTSARGIAAHCRGLLTSDVTSLEQAVELLSASPRVLERARAAEDAGAAHARAGEQARAIALLGQAQREYESVGATHDLARADSLLRALGVRRGRRGRRGRPASGWESLTESERQVAALAAEGLANPEIGRRLFISRRTVQAHLSHVFAKLELSSRVQLATAAARRERTVQQPRERLDQAQPAGEAERSVTDL